MFAAIEDQFAATAPTPKGRRARRAIFRAMRAAVAEGGVDAASLDSVADGAGLTQAALRHYFPTRDALVSAFFKSGADWYRQALQALLTTSDKPPREQLADCLRWHFEFMEEVESIFWLESSAYWLRDAEGRKIRDAWYGWLTDRYAALIGRARPEFPPAERRRRAYVLWTLVLGGWVTHGRGSPSRRALPAPERRRVLIDAALSIALG